MNTSEGGESQRGGRMGRKKKPRRLEGEEKAYSGNQEIGLTGADVHVVRGKTTGGGPKNQEKVVVEKAKCPNGETKKAKKTKNQHERKNEP